MHGEGRNSTNCPNLLQNPSTSTPKLEAGRSKNSKKVSSHVSLLRTLIVGESICWPDVGLTETIQRGARPVGQQESFGIFQERTREAIGSFADAWACSNSVIDSLKFRSPPPHDQRKAIYNKTKDEQELGLLSRFYSEHELDDLFGPRRWCAMLRFAVHQKGKYRMIDNGKQGANFDLLS